MVSLAELKWRVEEAVEVEIMGVGRGEREEVGDEEEDDHAGVGEDSVEDVEEDNVEDVEEANVEDVEEVDVDVDEANVEDVEEDEEDVEEESILILLWLGIKLREFSDSSEANAARFCRLFSSV